MPVPTQQNLLRVIRDHQQRVDTVPSRLQHNAHLVLDAPNNTTLGATAFKSATVQEVNALAQKLILRSAAGQRATEQQVHGPPPIQTIINNRILATNNLVSLNGGLAGLAPPGTTAANDQLYVTTSTNAINAAATAPDNGVLILRLGAFNGQQH